MDRLTRREKNGAVFCSKWSAECGVCEDCSQNDAILASLAKYEDTNLTPEEIDSMVASFLALTAVEYGKDRFFQQPNGTWYDRDKCDYVSTSKMILRSYLILEPYVSEDE